MPAPATHYWAKVKPVTTNETYGFFHRRKVMQEKAEREEELKNRPATADPRQSVTLPSISKSRLPAVKSAPPSRFPKDPCFETGNGNGRKLVPYIPASHSRYFTDGVRKTSYFTAEPMSPESDFENKGKVMYLWHSLMGCTVRVQV